MRVSGPHPYSLQSHPLPFLFPHLLPNDSVRERGNARGNASERVSGCGKWMHSNAAEGKSDYVHLMKLKVIRLFAGGFVQRVRTNMYVHIYVYIYMCVCVCVCVCAYIIQICTYIRMYQI